MRSNLDFLSTDNKINHIWISKNFHDWSGHINLVSSCLVIVHVNVKFSFVFLPFGHGLVKVVCVFIFSTWLNNMLIYTWIYYIHMDKEYNKPTHSSGKKAGKEIAEQPDQVKRIDDHWYQVKSQSLSKESWYDVILTETGLVCDCPDFQWRKHQCKHCWAVQFSQTLRNYVRKETVIEQVSYDKCPDCQSSNFVKHGIRHNKNYDLQRYFCNDCKKWFSFNLGFNGIKVNPKVVTSALQLYFTNESLRNVQKFLRLQGVEVSHQTIYNWIKKYTGLMEKYLDKITPQVGDKWRADEVYVKIKGNMKYLFAMMDEDTRFWLAQEVANTKERHDARNLLRMGKEFAQKTPLTLTTDGLRAYEDAFMKEFWTQRNQINVRHIRDIHFRGEKNNNMMERLNGEFRDREKIVRGLKKDNSPLFKGYQIYHNYVRPHMSLDGQTPADKAGIIIKGDDKWRTLIENASQ